MVRVFRYVVLFTIPLFRFVSTGKDNALNTWRTPYGFRLIKVGVMGINNEGTIY